MVLEDGRLVEKGSHEHLLGLKGRYFQLWELQAREANKEVQGPAAPGSGVTAQPD
jgi:hypothetical protein